jgi:hypothetical protein
MSCFCVLRDQLGTWHIFSRPDIQASGAISTSSSLLSSIFAVPPKVTKRRFPPPWSVEEPDACFVVKDTPGRSWPMLFTCIEAFVHAWAAQPAGQRASRAHRHAGDVGGGTHGLRTKSGWLATFAAIRRASSRMSSLAAGLRPGSSSK